MWEEQKHGDDDNQSKQSYNTYKSSSTAKTASIKSSVKSFNASMSSYRPKKNPYFNKIFENVENLNYIYDIAEKYEVGKILGKGYTGVVK